VKIIFILLAGAFAAPSLNAANRYQFDFRPGRIAESWAQVLPATSYSEERG